MSGFIPTSSLFGLKTIFEFLFGCSEISIHSLVTLFSSSDLKLFELVLLSSSNTNDTDQLNSIKALHDNIIFLKFVREQKYVHVAVNLLIQTFEFLKKVKLGKRSGIQCILCFNHISQAKKLSRNGQVPIADGVRCDGKKELLRIIDHLNSDAHNTASCAEKTQVFWMLQSDKNPWLKLLKPHESEVVTNLIELAIDTGKRTAEKEKIKEMEKYRHDPKEFFRQCKSLKNGYKPAIFSLTNEKGDLIMNSKDIAEEFKNYFNKMLNNNNNKESEIVQGDSQEEDEIIIHGTEESTELQPNHRVYDHTVHYKQKF
ncbi:hypothetical protein QTP88_019735 [Uroleucon formosanum]